MIDLVNKAPDIVKSLKGYIHRTSHFSFLAIGPFSLIIIKELSEQKVGTDAIY